MIAKKRPVEIEFWTNVDVDFPKDIKVWVDHGRRKVHTLAVDLLTDDNALVKHDTPHGIEYEMMTLKTLYKYYQPEYPF